MYFSASSRAAVQRLVSSSSSSSPHVRRSVHTLPGRLIKRVVQQPLPQHQQQVRFMAEMPVPQSSQAVLFAGHPNKEGWEGTMLWWYTSSLALIMVIVLYSPDTELSTWARQEAEARLKLKSRGFSDFEFGVHYQKLVAGETNEQWDQFSWKALHMSEDDDDDDEDEEDEDDDDDDDE